MTATSAATEPRTARTVVVVGPETSGRFPDLGEIWHRRDLLSILVRRDLSVRYKQSALGALWAVLQPVGLAAVFSVFLGALADVPSQAGIPYPVFAVSGMVMWLLFANAMSTSAASTLASADIIKKVYFPRLIIPLAAALPAAVDFAVAFVVVLGVMLAYGIVPHIQVLLVPVAMLLALGTALGAGLWFSALYVRYHDIPLVVPFLLMTGLFITPIVYPFSLVPDHLHWLYSINPMVGVLEFYRWALFPSADWPGLLLLIPLAASLLLLTSGAIYFQRVQRNFADVI